MILTFVVCEEKDIVSFHPQINFKKEQTPVRNYNAILHEDRLRAEINRIIYN